MSHLCNHCGCVTCSQDTGLDQSPVTRLPDVSDEAAVNNFTALLSDRSWTALTGKPMLLTYSFTGTRGAEAHVTERYGAAATNTVTELSATQKADVKNAIAQVEAASGVKFYEVDSGGTVTFQMMDFSTVAGKGSAAGFAFYPGTSVTTQSVFHSKIAGDVFFDSQDFPSSRSILDTALHEIGHALGLKHPFEGDPTLGGGLDNSAQTIMSYTGPQQTTFGPLDIEALQHIYGKPGDIAQSISAYSFDAATTTLTQAGTGGGDQMIGTDGRDAMRGLDGNDIVSGGFGEDQIFGGNGNDRMHGGDGNDQIFGSFGNDTAYGGDGNDEIYMGYGDDSIVEYSGGGNDTMGGGFGNDRLIAGDGDDWLFGGQSDANNGGADYFSAGAGNDLVFGGRGVAASENDTIFAGAGNDTVYAGVGNEQVSGNDGDDLLFGGGDSDNIFGGTGADTLWGGAGRDSLSGEENADVFGFTAGSGQDFIFGFNTAEDRIWLTGTVNTFNSFADVQAKLSGTGSAVIDLGGGSTVFINGIAASSLTADDFIFG
ncbi:MAG: matrixin family metalloprotease [Pseudomonadota bacterium]